MNNMPALRNFNKMLIIKRKESPLYRIDTVLFVGDYEGKNLEEKRSKILRDYGVKLYKTHTAKWYAEEDEEIGSVIVDGAYRTYFEDDASVGDVYIYYDYRKEKVSDLISDLKSKTLAFCNREQIIARIENALSNEIKNK